MGTQALKEASCMKRWKKSGQSVELKLEPRLVSKTLGRGELEGVVGSLARLVEVAGGRTVGGEDDEPEEDEPVEDEPEDDGEPVGDGLSEVLDDDPPAEDEALELAAGGGMVAGASNWRGASSSPPGNDGSRPTRDSLLRARLSSLSLRKSESRGRLAAMEKEQQKQSSRSMTPT
ncbi:MAG: hypothetical protein M1832_002241 [Thelocarpon impressellum]|nr:MAG: hypothetical protein M1832_002241 [Thelocarpon impressellum]